MSDGTAIGVPEIVDLVAAAAALPRTWDPAVVARLNDYEAKVVRLAGEFVWHAHPETDELWLVLTGRVTLALRDRDVVLAPGQLYVVPRGVEHCPRVEDGEASVLLLEPQGVVNTGDAPPGELTRGTRDDPVGPA